MLRVTLTAAGALLAGAASAEPMACAGLMPEALGLAGVTFTEVAAVAAGEESPVAQCRVHGVMAERTGADGKSLRAPLRAGAARRLDGSYVHQFNAA